MCVCAGGGPAAAAAQEAGMDGKRPAASKAGSSRACPTPRNLPMHTQAHPVPEADLAPGLKAAPHQARCKAHERPHRRHIHHGTVCGSSAGGDSSRDGSRETECSAGRQVLCGAAPRHGSGQGRGGAVPAVLPGPRRLQRQAMHQPQPQQVAAAGCCCACLPAGALTSPHVGH